MPHIQTLKNVHREHFVAQTTFCATRYTLSFAFEMSQWYIEIYISAECDSIEAKRLPNTCQKKIIPKIRSTPCVMCVVSCIWVKRQSEQYNEKKRVHLRLLTTKYIRRWALNIAHSHMCIANGAHIRFRFIVLYSLFYYYIFGWTAKGVRFWPY